MGRDPEKYYSHSLRPYRRRARYTCGYAVSPTPEHRDAVHILGYGSEEELKYCMAQWRRWHPELFEEVQSA